MAQLLKITSVPIKLEMTTQKAQLKTSNSEIKMNMTAKRATLSMQSQDTKVKIDSYPSRKSMGLYNSADASTNQANLGAKAVQESMGTYTDIGNQMARIDKGASIPDILYSKIFKTPTTEQVFLPNVKPDIQWDLPQLDIQYNPPQLDLQWNLTPTQREYIPGSIEFKVIQYPEVIIEYLGEPNYVPKRANAD